MKIHKQLQMYFLLSIFALLTFSVTPNAVVAAGNSSKAAPSKFAGTYYLGMGGTLTIHSDGTISAISPDLFSFSDARSGRRSTPYAGVWRKIGNNEIQATTLAFFTEPFGDDYIPDGLISKLSYRLIFDDPVGGVIPGFKGVDLVAEIFLPSQNPTDDDEIPVAVVSVPDDVAYRLQFQD